MRGGNILKIFGYILSGLTTLASAVPILQVLKAGKTTGLDHYAYLMGYFTSCCWVVFALGPISSDLTNGIINGCAAGLYFLCTSVFWSYSTKSVIKIKIGVQWFIGTCLVFFYALAVVFGISNQETRKLVAGWFSVFMGTMCSVFPLRDMYTILRNKDPRLIQPWLLLMALTNASVWGAYGIVKRLPSVKVLYFIAVLSGITQLILYLWVKYSLRKALMERGNFVYMAKVAGEAERYEEMVEFMEKVAKTGHVKELTVGERYLLHVAYKKVIGARRTSWKIISSIEQMEESCGNEEHATIVKDYRTKVETELLKMCDEILNLLDSHLVHAASTAESKVFYLKMKGDYHRYFVEFRTGAEWKKAVECTLFAYTSAQDIAVAELPPSHFMRLGLALNISVFYYAFLKSPDQARAIAKKAFDEAISELDEEADEDDTLIMQHLKGMVDSVEVERMLLQRVIQLQ